MNGLFRAFLAGAAGTYAASKWGHKVTEYLKPESEFAKTAVNLGIAGGTTAAAWYAIGAIIPGVK